MKYAYQLKSQWSSIEYFVTISLLYFIMKTLLHFILRGVFLRYYNEKV